MPCPIQFFLLSPTVFHADFSVTLLGVHSQLSEEQCSSPTARVSYRCDPLRVSASLAFLPPRYAQEDFPQEFFRPPTRKPPVSRAPFRPFSRFPPRLARRRTAVSDISVPVFTLHSDTVRQYAYVIRHLPLSSAKRDVRFRPVLTRFQIGPRCRCSSLGTKNKNVDTTIVVGRNDDGRF